MSETEKPTPVQSSAATSAPPADVFATLRASLEDPLTVIERGTGYVVVGRQRPIKGLREGSIAIAVLGVMVVLVLTAITPLFILLLPLPLVTAIPFLLDRRERVAVAAMGEEDGETVVTLHGRATPQLQTTLSEFLSRLPQVTS